MCGIAGLWLRNGVTHSAERRVAVMTASLAHRGPDGNGLTSLPTNDASQLWLGHRRLSILDLTDAGRQPMHDAATGNWIVFNGEIYNHGAVREELGGSSVQWFSQCDTETILRAYATWGSGCLARLRGMFAFAIYDAARQTLFCARDRFGIKPFYFAETAEGIAFASEVGALLRAGIVEPVLDRAGLASYVRFGSVSEPFTMFADIQALPAATWMEITGSRVTRQVPYWDVTTQALAVDDGPPQRRIREYLERAVREHLLADVPVASFLSGGVDSSVITALAAQQSSRPLRTFTVGFAGTDLDERRFASAVAQRYGTQHCEVLLDDAEAAQLLPMAVSAMDQPTSDGVNTFIVSHAVRGSGTKVVLSGLGADELFGSYRSFRLLPVAHGWAKWLGGAPSRVASALAGDGRRAELFRHDASLVERYETLRSYWSVADLHRMNVQHMAAQHADSNGHTLGARISLLEIEHYMRNTLLRDSDAMSMAHSIELRVPFLDHELAAYAVQNGVMGHGNKPVLIEATRDLLPACSVRRPKQGFVLPMAAWMRGPLARYVNEGVALLERSNALPGVPIRELYARFDRGSLPWSRLWQFVVLGHWLSNVTGHSDNNAMPETMRERVIESESATA